MVWGLVRSSPSLVRYGPMGGCVGLDWPALLAAAEAVDVPPDALVMLLPSIETGMLEALNEKGDGGRN